MRVKYSGFLSSSFQRVLLDVLNSPGLTWFPSPDGSSITRSALTAGVASVIFHGSDLVRAGDGSVSGTVREFELSSAGGGSVDATGNNMNADLAQLVAAAGAVTNGFGSPEYIDFLDVLMRPNNRIIGTSHRDVLESGPGNDTLAGRAGNDVFVLHPDAASPAAAAAGPAPIADVVRGGAGAHDVLLIEHPDGAPTTSMNGGRKYLIQLGDGFVLDLDDSNQPVAMIFGIEDVRGSRANESIIGDEAGNRVYGGGGGDYVDGRGGNDRLFGGAGPDRLVGGRGADYLKGGTGADTLEGGVGRDTMIGGSGHDVFHFNAGILVDYQGHDTITDFDALEDKIRIIGGDPVDIQVSLSNGNTVIDYGNGVVTLMGVQLMESDITFIF